MGVQAPLILWISVLVNTAAICCAGITAILEIRGSNRECVELVARLVIGGPEYTHLYNFLLKTPPVLIY